MQQEPNLIKDLTFDFSLKTIEYVEKLEQKRKYVLANQLLKSSTSIGANVREAQQAESKADFLHKLKISMKESDETEYWLQLCAHAKDYPDCSDLIFRQKQIANVLAKIIITTTDKYFSGKRSR